MSYGNYQTSKRVDIGREVVCRLSSAIDSMTYNPADYWDQRTGLIDDWPYVDSADTDAGEAFIEIRKSSNGSDFGAWERFIAGDHVFRAIEARAAMTTSDPTVNVLIRSFDVQVDMPDLVQQSADVLAPAGLFSVSYETEYRVVPAVAISAQGMQAGDYYEISNKTVTGFDIVFRNMQRVLQFHERLTGLQRGTDEPKFNEYPRWAGGKFPCQS